MIRNILEFWRVPGFAVDYTTVFELPALKSGGRYSLTHDNIMRYSNATQIGVHSQQQQQQYQHQLGLPTLASSGSGGVSGGGGGGSGGLEMQTHTQPTSDRTTTNSIHYYGSGRAGPPSIDLNMTKMRGDSMDSNDTNGSQV